MAKSHPDKTLTARQLRAGRQLLGLAQSELARKSKVSLPTIKRLELMNGHLIARDETIDKLRFALERNGLELIPDGAASSARGGAGVRLKKRDRQ